MTEDYTEDASRRVAEEVAGFDVILFGHDHRPHQSVHRFSFSQLGMAGVIMPIA